MKPHGGHTHEAAYARMRRTYLPTRYVGHWQALLGELRGAGLEILAHRYHAAGEESCVGNLAVACRRSPA